MKLIGSLGSPFARKVRVALAEKRVDYEFVIDPPADPATRVPEFNPLGKIDRALAWAGADLADKTWCAAETYSLADMPQG